MQRAVAMWVFFPLPNVDWNRKKTCNNNITWMKETLSNRHKGVSRRNKNNWRLLPSKAFNSKKIQWFWDEKKNISLSTQWRESRWLKQIQGFSHSFSIIGEKSMCAIVITACKRKQSGTKVILIPFHRSAYNFRLKFWMTESKDWNQ